MKKNILLIPILLVTLVSCSSKNNIENDDNVDGYYFEIDAPFLVDEANYGVMKTIMSLWLFE